MSDYHYLTVNGRPLGLLSPRDEEVYAAGKIAAQADLHHKVKTLLNDMHSDWSNPRYQAVLDLLDGNSD